MKNRFQERISMFIASFLFCSPFALILGTLIYIGNPHPSNDFMICNNVQKLYKDDLLFDNFYIGCDSGATHRVTAELYARIIQDKNYKIIFNNLGGIYSIERIDDN